MPDVSRHPSSRAEFRERLVELIAHRALVAPAAARPDVRRSATRLLFETGLVDSMAILELIAFVEGATGRTISARQVHMKHFGTVDRICDAFWMDGNGERRLTSKGGNK